MCDSLFADAADLPLSQRAAYFGVAVAKARTIWVKRY